jgi:hypothetical protein
MQRKSNSKTRGPNAEEKKFQLWLKGHDCVWCGNPGPGIVDHCRGATFRHNKILIGHRFCISQCWECDHRKTIGGKRQGNEAQSWLKLNAEYELETGIETPYDEVLAIQDWDK